MSETNDQLAVLGPMIMPATQLSIAITDAEITITFGVSRQVFAGVGPAGNTVEWTHSFGLSATTAEKLLYALQQAIPHYVKAYGAIPRDPNFQMATTGPTVS